MRTRKWLPALVALVVTGVIPVVASRSAAASTPRSSAFGSDWSTYHGNSLSTGVDPAGTDLTPLSAAWSSPALDGQLYGEPLLVAGRVVVATESDTVYALSARTGQVVWQQHVGTPVPDADVVCGDIGPTVGITGTPVIDTARDEIFAVANELVRGVAAHYLVGLDLFTGRVELDEVVDPPGSVSGAQLQRTALVLADGQVVMGIGSNAGDCGGPYHGYVVAVPEGGGPPRDFEVDTGTGQLFGSVWMGGAAPLVDPQGNIWVTSGNGWATSDGQPYDRSDSVLELSPKMTLEQYFAPTRWAQDNAADADLGTTAPAFVGNLVFQVGKDRVAYLMDRDHLGGIGGDIASMPLCGSGTGVDYAASPFGGDAVDGSTVYVPCRDGVTAVAVQATPNPSMRVLWTTPTGSSGGAVVAGGLVWTISQTGTLYGLDPATGAAEVSEPIGGVSNHFPTPAVADGLLLVPGSVHVLAFKGPAGLPPAPQASPAATAYWTAYAGGAMVAAGGAGAYGSLAGNTLPAPIVGAASTPDGHGYWLAGADGSVYPFGDALSFGSMAGRHLNAPVVGIAPTFDGQGYWLVASDGGVFAFGDARFLGSTGGQHLNAPVVALEASPGSRGYRLVASDGGVFTFGEARFLGSMGGSRLNAPVTAAAATPDGEGYWLLGADGGVFTFGDARFDGSAASGDGLGGRRAVSIGATLDGGGYWIAGAGGNVVGFGDAEVSPSAGEPPADTATAVGVVAAG
jgi:polyvinyl alcohol dehydrogenase (cytochrome)